MKQLITTYTFVPAAKTVQLTGITSVSLKGLLLITNVTSNIIIYNFADSTKGATVGGNTITLVYDTTSMGAGDSLQIFYDDGSLYENPTSKYNITDIDPTAGNQYFGYTDQDGIWYIMNLTTTTARYIKGSSNYTASWTGRAALSYDYFYNIF